ncbi:3-dehydroquinate synthase family protein [Streptomyces europaeiscabiei]|uniref:3-dehydroquinate synthase family protein n=1 Tax=Streptomyces europaeiscabiei TaxID=146819 RepID=UPI0013C4D485|nr:iron-containing alcohol dehydrogenase [Streptomyces europaeiscabiei]
MAAELPEGERLVLEDEQGFTLRAPDGTSYRVDIAEALLDPANRLLAEVCDGRRVVAFISPNANRLFGEQVRQYLTGGLATGNWTVEVIPTGEDRKNMASVEDVVARAKAARLDRNGVMLAIGGGVLCDIVGFAAAIYHRGIHYIKVNTTLVGQVDVGVGIKTGVNALGAKNFAGAFHPALRSINDPAFLRTLPPREIRCGLGEITKMAVIKDAQLCHTLQAYSEVFHRYYPAPEWLPAVGGVRQSLEDYVLRTSMRLMLEELAPNLRERNLARLVDFGHTFGPVIETASGHRIAHGESVAIDMAISSELARMLGLLTPEDCEQIVSLISALGLPVYDALTCTPELMHEALRVAWERRGRRLHLVVPTALGSATFVDDLEDIPAAALAQALETLALRPSGPPDAAEADSARDMIHQPVPNLHRDLLSPVANDHGGTGTILTHRIYRRRDGPAGIAFIDLVVLPPHTSIGLHHHADDIETYVVLNGHGCMTLEGHEIDVGPGDVIANRPYGRHGLANPTETELYLLVFDIRPMEPPATNTPDSQGDERA